MNSLNEDKKALNATIENMKQSQNEELDLLKQQQQELKRENAQYLNEKTELERKIMKQMRQILD